MPIDDWDALLQLDRWAVLATTGLVARATPDDRDRPTPCADWTLRHLVTHMTGQQIGFAAAARGGSDLASWRPNDAAYAPACEDMFAAFAELTPASTLVLPELGADAFPADLAIEINLVDNVVHAWDVAITLGTRPELDDDVLGVALAVAERVPDDEGRDRAGAAFAHALPAVAGDDDLDRLLRQLGRDPAWAPVSR